MTNSLVLVFGFITSLGGLAGVAALINVRSQRGKINAEAKKIGVDADAVVSDKALEMYQLARTEAQEAKAEARECREKVMALEDHVDHLERIMRDSGLKPPPFHYPLLRIEGGAGQ